MKKLQTRIKTLLAVFDRWLSDDNEYLLRAVNRTVEEGYFSFQDVQFALKCLRQQLHEQALKEWVQQSGISDDNDACGQNTLCLHAGNLPLVGFQDALAVLLSGARYTGKISRKDPYLLPVFLNEVKKTNVWDSTAVQWSHHLQDFEDMRNDMILFAGSEQSVPGVKEAIQRFNLQTESTRFLIRSAHFSMAYFDDRSQDQINALTSAILQYDGKGCRSVAVVVSPFELNSMRADLKKSFSNFWKDFPPHKKPEEKLRQRFAYNEAVERPQLWLNNFLIQQGGLELDQDFICHWVQGDEETVRDLSNRFGGRLQCIYTDEDENGDMNAVNAQMDELANAQNPSIGWKPDGTNILSWLCGGDRV